MHEKVDQPQPPTLDGQDGEQAVREQRQGRLFMGEMTMDNGSIVKIRIRNLSANGLGGHAEIPLRAEQRGQMIVAGVGHVSGRIAWTRGNNFGMQFDQPVDAELARMSVPTSAPRSDFVVADRFRPVTDHKRPGFRIR